MRLNSDLNNMSWRIKSDDVLIEVGKLFGSKIGLQKLNYEVILINIYKYLHDVFSSQNFSLTQVGVSSGRGSIASAGSIAAPQETITIGVYKCERVTIKKILKKKVSHDFYVCALKYEKYSLTRLK